MSKLLKETQIRRFMKLASIGNLSEGFVDNLGEDEEMGEGMGGAYGRDEEHMMEEEEMDLEDDEDPPPQMDDDEGMEPDEGVEDSVMDIISTIATALEAEYPEIDIDVAQDGEAGGEPMDDMGDEIDDEEGEAMDDDMGDDMGDAMGDEGDEEAEEVLEDIDMVDEDELVAEVLKRVTARLRKTLAENKRRNRR
jgi:rRNA biogenesis protein RRP5